MSYTKVVVVGGGFGGLHVTQGLKKADVDILLIDRNNHHLFQPLLYQVATAALSPSNIAIPLREIFRNQPNASVIMADIVQINKEEKYVQSFTGEKFYYDYLVIAIGSRHSYFGNNQWEPLAPGLKTIPDAIRIRESILMSFENAEKCDSFKEIANYLRFVIIGGGPTGVEMAGSIAEIAKKSLFNNFRRIKPEQSEIYLIEGEKQILPTYPPSLSAKALKDLEQMGVNVMLNAKVTNVTEDGVYIGDKFIATKNVIWAAGNQVPPLLKTLNVELDRQGRAIVEADMSLPGHPEIFVVGDAAHVGDNGKTLPGIAPVAIQEGKYVSKIIAKKTPQDQRKPFKYFDKGSMATIGKARAIAMMGKGKVLLSGFIAWLAWCFLHIFYLISFRNRLIVMIEWFYWYLTNLRPVRIISRPIDEIYKTEKKELDKKQSDNNSK
ncbi:NADH dehydrogenase [Candidatus Rubidus massiliensis]|nr:MAG: FAD-dependent oxidoreductase [Chlamydia sp. 32-24]CDZ81094.1 NADH dehydrogenase [Candidatus Rubidus massiliensis]